MKKCLISLLLFICLSLNFLKAKNTEFEGAIIIKKKNFYYESYVDYSFVISQDTLCMYAEYRPDFFKNIFIPIRNIKSINKRVIPLLNKNLIIELHSGEIITISVDHKKNDFIEILRSKFIPHNQENNNLNFEKPEKENQLLNAIYKVNLLGSFFYTPMYFAGTLSIEKNFLVYNPSQFQNMIKILSFDLKKSIYEVKIVGGKIVLKIRSENIDYIFKVNDYELLKKLKVLKDNK